jgi:nicotinamide mononucleotide (NMN) deamidase PncC
VAFGFWMVALAGLMAAAPIGTVFRALADRQTRVTERGPPGRLADRHHLVSRCDSLSGRFWSPLLGRAALGFAGCANSQGERKPAGLVCANMATPDHCLTDRLVAEAG